MLIAQGAFGGVALPPDFDTTFDQDGHTVHQSAIYRYGFELNGTSLGPAGTPYISQLIGIPEPASWALMLCGFFGLGGALRARRRTAVA